MNTTVSPPGSRRVPRRASRWLAGLASLALGAAFADAHAQATPSSSAQSSSPPPAVRALPPEERILVQAWADSETTLSSPMTGRITSIRSQMGGHFAQGDLLVGFECTEQEAKVRMAQAELNAASDTLEAKLRLKALESASDVEISAAAAAVNKAEAQLHLTRFQVTQCAVTAPFSGFVVRVAAKAHQTVTTGQPLLEIVSDAPPKLRVNAHSRLLSRIVVGTPLTVFIEETRRSYSASVSAVNARVDPVNQTIELEARLTQAASGLLPGMSGTAALARATSGTDTLSASAASTGAADARGARKSGGAGKSGR